MYKNKALSEAEGWRYLGDGVYWRVENDTVELVAFDGMRVYNEIYINKNLLIQLVLSETFAAS